MNVNSINSQTNRYYRTKDISKKEKVLTNKDRFSYMLENMRKFRSPNYERPPKQVEDDEQMTITRLVLSDGSVLTIVTKGKEIISRTKSPAIRKEANVKVMSTQTQEITSTQTQEITSAQTQEYTDFTNPV
ncbi:hypothetical protein [Lachnobacterium bovis]|uniref:Uncharacterized protein n=1 Tax=Lachnobacterium bovis TaxID=140626 RepID=A0A1H9PAN8_9FIRM|nr:hypothetical protein [Lachnobacterium bovis]SER45222.1 hypothetical protein SAMN02910429_00169 [Lachnobacterium bovis]